MAEANQSLFSYPFPAMGSPCELQIYAFSHILADAAAKLAIDDVYRLEKKYSRYRNDSLLSSLNRVANDGAGVDVDDETAGLLNYADTCYRESQGLFDITSGLLRHAWHFDRGQLPTNTEITSLLARIGWNKVDWSPPRLSFKPGMEIDFGGIVKEYAADRVAAICHNAGIAHGFINLGGDIRIIGPHPDDSPWHIGVKHPRSMQGAIGEIALQHGGIATSGDYERCIVIDGKRYGHVLNPTTGWPVHFLTSVTVIADLCVVAGSASTIAMLKGSEGPEWLSNLGLPHFWVDIYGNYGGSLIVD